jgi:hypothetical protein
LVSLLVSIIYIIVFVFSGLFPPLGITRSLLGFIILVYLLGASVRLFLKYVTGISKLPSTLGISGLSCDILLSFLLSLTISSILIQTFLLYENILIFAVVPPIIFLNAVTLFALKKYQNLVDPNTAPILKKRSLAPILSLIVLFAASSLFSIYFRSKTPFPAINGWDLNPSLAYVNWTISNHGFQYIFIPSFPSGLNPYPALFFNLISYYSLFLGIDPFVIYWYSVYILILSYMVLIFLIALKLSKNYWLSLTSAFIAFFTSAALAEEVRTPLYLTLDMVGQLLFLLIIVFYIYYCNSGKEKKIICLVAITCLAFFNYLTVIVVLPFLMWIVVDSKNLRFLGNGRRVFRLTAIGLALSFSILVALGSYLSLGVASLFAPSTIPYLSVISLQKIYPVYFWVLFILTLFSVFVYHFRGRQRESLYLDILLFICCSFAIYFFPAEITRRFEFYIRVFLAIFISGLLISVPNKKYIITFPATISKKLRQVNINLKTIASFCLLFLTIAQMYPLFTNYASNFQAFISKDEYDAAKWLNDNTPPAAYILTDPSSGYVFRGLALRNSSISFILPDGRMPADSSGMYPNLKQSLHEFLSSQSIVKSMQTLQEIPFNQSYIVVTSRTVFWALNSVDAFSTSPRMGMNYSTIINKFIEPYFLERYNSSTVRIFQPNPSLRIENRTIWVDRNFTKGWSWYLDGAYGNHTLEVDNNIPTLTTQAKTEAVTWTGIIKQLNCSGSSFLEIKSKINLNPNLLEIVLYNINRRVVGLFYLEGQTGMRTWSVDRFSLSKIDVDDVAEVALIIYSRDTNKYSWEIDYVMFADSFIVAE